MLIISAADFIIYCAGSGGRRLVAGCALYNGDVFGRTGTSLVVPWAYTAGIMAGCALYSRDVFGRSVGVFGGSCGGLRSGSSLGPWAYLAVSLVRVFGESCGGIRRVGSAAGLDSAVCPMVEVYVWQVMAGFVLRALFSEQRGALSLRHMARLWKG